MAKSNPKIVFVTFLNNFSGSPNVLSIIAKQFIQKNYDVKIITNKSEGFLSNIKGAKYEYVVYKWSGCVLSVLIYFIIAQIQLFFKILFRSKENTLFYVNTVTPIGAVWACKLTGKKIIYHVHENMQQNKSFYGVYRWTYRHCNTKTIFVSEYLEKLAVGCKDGIVIHNSLISSFLDTVKLYLSENSYKGDKILLVSSLRKYKGVYEFVELAKRLPQYEFEMVLSAAEAEIVKFRIETLSPPNLLIYPVQKKLHPFYQRAKLLLQLSHPTGWIETFGLTILEAMVYGVPAIVPNIGGPVELIDDGVNGFTIDPLNVDLLTEKVKELMGNEILYARFSKNALEKSKQFNLQKMIGEIEKYIIQ